MESYENLTAQLQYYEAGEQVDFVIARADGGEYKEQTITIELGAKKMPSRAARVIPGAVGKGKNLFIETWLWNSLPIL